MKKDRQFLTFKTNPIIQNLNDKIQVFTDQSGGFEFLAEISLRDFAKVAQSHFEIVDNDRGENLKHSTERDKLLCLIPLWREIDHRISGYLFGDLPENNP